VTRRCAIVLLLFAALPAAAAAQAVGAARTLTMTIDNDLLAVRGAGAPPDYDYTHGARVAVAWAAAPEAVGRVLGRRPGCGSAEARRGGCLAATLTVGQEIYTPRRDASVPVPGERPYAGWLYAAAAAHAVARGRSRSVVAEVGVTGPPSLAEPVQNGVHQLLGNQTQLGWAHQLPAAPGFTVRYGEVRRTEWEAGGPAIAAVGLRWGAAAGTLLTALHAGADVTLGRSGHLPWSPGRPEDERPMRLYATAAYRQDAVLRNVFVDGRGSAAHAVRRTLVGQGEVAVGYRRRSFAIEYRHVIRGREYAAQPSAHAYGSVVLTILHFRASNP